MFSGKACTAKTGKLDQGFMHNSNQDGVKSELVNSEKCDMITVCYHISALMGVQLNYRNPNRPKLDQSVDPLTTCVVFYYTCTHELTPVSDRPVFAQVYWYGKNVNYMWF